MARATDATAVPEAREAVIQETEFPLLLHSAVPVKLSQTRRFRGRVHAAVGPDPARVDSGARGTRACLPTARSRHRVSDRAECGLHDLEESHDRATVAAASRSSYSAAAGP